MNGVLCGRCGSELAPLLLRCPSCGRLSHADRLKEMTALAEEAEKEKRWAEAASTWRDMLALIPPEADSFPIVRRRAEEAVRRTPAKKGAPRVWKIGGMAGLLLGLLWKGKVALLFGLGKLKFIFLGLSKAPVLFSALSFLGVYWVAWGLPFAIGLMVSIYIHEMGHVWQMRRFGIAVGAPIFIPGVGAFVRARQNFTGPREEARVGLAGPWWGLGATLACVAIHLITGFPFWGALAHIGAWINLLNLIPIAPLDGGRAFHSLHRRGRWGVCVAACALWFFLREGLLVLVVLVALFQALSSRDEGEPDNSILIQFIALMTALSLISQRTVSFSTIP